MQHKARVWIFATLLGVLGAASSLLAQQPLRDTPSHRFIPPGTAPQLDAFKSPEYEPALEQVRKLHKAYRDARKAASAPAPNTLDPSNLETFSQETQKLWQDFSPQSVNEASQQIGRGLADFNRRLSQGDFSETSDGENSFDSAQDIFDQYKAARKAWGEQRALTTAEYNKARQLFREQWPTEKIPPAEWLRKVQPFINPEVIGQLAKIRDYKDGKTTKMPELPNALLPKTPPASLSKRMIEAVVKNLDQSSSDLIKRAKRDNQGKNRTPWWKQLKARANSKMKSLNKSITDRTAQYAAETASSAPAIATRPERSLDQSGSGRRVASIACVVVVLLGVGYYVIGLRSGHHAEQAEWRKIMEPGAICDRESMLRAIHGVAANQFGRASRYWHHRRLFNQFREHSEVHDPVIDALYERVRYAADGSTLSNDDLDLARRWCEQVRAAGANS